MLYEVITLGLRVGHFSAYGESLWSTRLGGDPTVHQGIDLLRIGLGVVF